MIHRIRGNLPGRVWKAQTSRQISHLRCPFRLLSRNAWVSRVGRLHLLWVDLCPPNDMLKSSFLVPYLEIGSCWCSQVKMRSYWQRVDPKLMWLVFSWEERQRQRKEEDGWGKWRIQKLGDTFINQGMPWIISKPQKRQRRYLGQLELLRKTTATTTKPTNGVV